MGSFKHILVPTDFSACSRDALDLATDLAEQFAATLTIAHTVEIPTYAYTGMPFVTVDLITPIQEAARDELERALAEVRKRLPGAEAVLRTGNPWEEILTVAAERQADLIVMGTHGRRGVRHALLGSVAEKIVRTSPIAVLTVRARAAASPGAATS